MLRKRQVEIVNSFVADIRGGRSRVQQMIMGAGSCSFRLFSQLVSYLIMNLTLKQKQRQNDCCWSIVDVDSRRRSTIGDTRHAIGTARAIAQHIT